MKIEVATCYNIFTVTKLHCLTGKLADCLLIAVHLLNILLWLLHLFALKRLFGLAKK